MPPGAPLPGQLPQPPNQKRPPLGFTSSQYCQWNDYGLKPQVDVLERTGLKDLGFKTFVIACEWNKGMDPEGKLIVDDKQFEGGLTGFGRFLQDKQMKFGLRIDSVCLFVTAGAIQNPDLSKVTNDPYIQMKQSIQRSQKDIFLATGQWGVTDETRLETADTWRVNNPAKEDWQKIRPTINAMVALSHKSDPGHFNDLDAIDWNHRDLSPMEQATQQDALGKSITFRRRYTNDNDVWAGELSDGSMVAMLINWKDEERELTLSLADVELTSANGFDVISGKDLGPSNTTQSKTKRMGKAVLRPVTDKLQAMTYLEPDGVGAVQFVNLEGGDKGGRLLVAIDYINSKLDDFSPSWCPNCLIAKIKVNDAPEVEIEFPITGLTNNIPMSYLVELDGFKPGSDNTLTYTGAHKQAAPDITQISFFSASAPSGYQ
ncbi:family 31 glycoside hydrolase [Melampsora larici-populina 98AG31]|uniref:alpha-galactosidase n=1 Tax=Melampsora larici-populina (strain 98AG31 / pathotype 3-4-7) TaxID=747676 RepID=F4SD42_MELLP|nr:family 31 glycoside hydrolase [Melampsora larici-populina 98AG31]EGF97435.1 family 31 glycoside hydrolase [Melampsora larici-populina 98AG31]